jgi:hypothetical protein
MMPRFLDHHPVAHATTTDVALEALQNQIRAGQADDFGVKYLDAYVAVNGEGYCLSESPDADAVVKSHGMLGYTIDSADVIEVVSLSEA